MGRARYYVICFLEEVFDTLADAFDSTSRGHPHDIQGFTTVQDRKDIKCYRVWFHAKRGANKDKTPVLRRQLRFLSAEAIDRGWGTSPRGSTNRVRVTRRGYLLTGW